MIIPKEKIFSILTYHELDDLIQQHFNKPDFACVADYEWHNDSWQVGVVRIQDIEDENALDYEELQEFINDPGVPPYPVHWSTLLAELARRGEVPQGNYLIEVCW